MSKKIKLSNITPDDKNNNKHTAYGMDLLEKSVNKVGIIESITISNDDKIISGNARHEVIGKHFEKEALVIETDGTQPIVIKRTDIESNTKEFYEASILANTTSKKNIDFDMEVIDSLAVEYDIDAVDLGVDLVEEIPEAQEDDFNGVPPKEPITVLGDLYELGEHRLHCADSCDSDALRKLMNNKKANMVFTDPPYLMDFDGGMTTNPDGNWIKSYNSKHDSIKNDKMDKSKEADFLDSINANIQLFCSGSFYICFYRLKLGDYFASLDRTGLKVRTLITWDKGNHTMSNSDYWSKCEHIFYGWINEHKFYGKSDYDIWQIARTKKNDLHPTMKPIALVEKAITNSSEQNGIILDLFVGSGSTIIASDQLNRICYGQELEPKYCDVIVARYINHKGTDSNLIIKRNGQQLSKSEIQKYIENTSEAK